MNDGDDSLPDGAIGPGSGAPPPLPSSSEPPQWHPGGTVVVHPNRFVTVGCVIAGAVLVVVMVTQDLGPPVLLVVLGALLVFVVIVFVESLVGEVRVDSVGISRRSVRGTRAYRREQLTRPVLHRYLRPSRSGRHPVLRLTIRLPGGRYGFQITSDLFSMSDVDRVAGLVKAERSSARSPADLEALYPGSTRPWQRHPVLFVIAVAVVTWIVVGIMLTQMT